MEREREKQTEPSGQRTATQRRPSAAGAISRRCFIVLLAGLLVALNVNGARDSCFHATAFAGFVGVRLAAYLAAPSVVPGRQIP